MTESDKIQAKDEERIALLMELATLADSDHDLDGLTAEDAVRYVASLIRQRKGKP